ncbi:MAG: hypothetical protein Q7J10_07950 [Methanosarcinaceae archaeon]|nr:hypothetical protein [Methanosarcinaceae archaeon]
MKRLTISMSDELFDRLDKIENKSLFVRDIIERELSSETVGDESTVLWLDELNELRVENKELTDRLNEIDKRLESTQSMVQAISRTVETRYVERAIPKMEIVVPELAQPKRVVSEPEIAAITEFRPTNDNIKQQSSTIQDTNPVEETLSKTSINDMSFSESTSFAQTSSVPIPSMPTPSISTPSKSPQLTVNSDKLEGNILMYILHGAEIKRSIIKSLLSKRYDPKEIDVKLDHMIGAGTLSTAIKDDTEYLVRV